MKVTWVRFEIKSDLYCQNKDRYVSHMGKKARFVKLNVAYNFDYQLCFKLRLLYNDALRNNLKYFFL